MPFRNLSDALYARGYTASVWVNSLAAGEPYLAHGEFHPERAPFGPDYGNRYAMRVEGGGSVEIPTSPNTTLKASGSAKNDLQVTSDGSILVELLRDGQMIDGQRVRFEVPAGQSLAWGPLTFPFATYEPGHAYTVRVSRQVEGARSGGERNVEFNSPDFHDNIAAYFNLPETYVFTSADLTDCNYVCRPNDSDSVLGSLIVGLRRPQAPPVVAPPVDPPAPPVDPPQPPAPPAPPVIPPQPPVPPAPPVVPPVVPPPPRPRLSPESMATLHSVSTWSGNLHVGQKQHAKIAAMVAEVLALVGS